MIKQIDFGQLKSSISVVRALRLLGWQPTSVEHAGVRGPCPLHGSSRRGSRTFSVDGPNWYCWKCKRGGDVLLLWAELHEQTIVQAALDLCDRCGITVPRLG